MAVLTKTRHHLRRIFDTMEPVRTHERPAFHPMCLPKSGSPGRSNAQVIVKILELALGCRFQNAVGISQKRFDEGCVAAANDEWFLLQLICHSIHQLLCELSTVRWVVIVSIIRLPNGLLTFYINYNLSTITIGVYNYINLWGLTL